MHRNKSVLLFLVVVLSSFTIQPNKPHLSKWVINNECSLKVGGSTNVNKFNCAITNYRRPDTLTFYKGNGSEPVKISGFLALDVDKFDCQNPVMTSDLRKTLKAKAFPKLIIRFINLSKYPDYNDGDQVKGLVTIELAGVTKRFDVDYRVIPAKNNSLTLIGTRQVKFSDFNIVPPRKIGGMIQTNNELNVEFNLKVKVLN